MMTAQTTGSIHLGLLLHNHQPVGNFPWVFQQVYEDSYLPMLKALERHPGVRVSLHYTGSLLDWMAEAQPAFLQRIAALVQRGQVEMVGGGYYEPILPSIPDSDKLAQIRRLSSAVTTLFGTSPTGMWIAERVWEPSLPQWLHQAGMAWTVLDDIHFKNVGLEDKDLYGYYATEDQGDTLRVFATSKELRYTIPWRPVAETIQTLRKLATSAGNRILVMGDDGEKFGSWPETQLHCWGPHGDDGWVDEFFTALEEESHWLHTTQLGEFAHGYPALGRVYIPTSSYIEMTEWALPPQKSSLFSKQLHQLEAEKQEDLLQFMRGGFWRNFLVRYPEVNNQHKKMLRVHDLVYAMGAQEDAGIVQLWKAQANDTYWHGLFGGIYMAHVRDAIYHNLIEAENAANRLQYGSAHWQRYALTDFDRDTRDELIIESDQQNLYIAPLLGGGIFEWDIRRSAQNLTSVMTRHQESYHQTLREHEQERRRNAQQATPTLVHKEASIPESPHSAVRTKEDNLDRYLVKDRYRRNSLLDHFLPAGITLQTFAEQRFEEQGNFIEQPYECSVTQDDQGLTVKLFRSGQVKRAGTLSPLQIDLTKTLFLPLGQEQLVVTYSIENRSQSRLQSDFACEWNINLLGGGQNDQAYYHIEGQELADKHFDSTGVVPAVDTFHIGNTWLKQDMGFVLSQTAMLWRFSIETVTGSEAGFERTHQGSCIALCWPLLLDAGQSWHVVITCNGQDPA